MALSHVILNISQIFLLSHPKRTEMGCVSESSYVQIWAVIVSDTYKAAREEAYFPNYNRASQENCILLAKTQLSTKSKAQQVVSRLLTTYWQISEKEQPRANYK